jgi:hypothetical protein
MPLCGVVIRAADRWRQLNVGEFEQRQLPEIRDTQPCSYRECRARRSGADGGPQTAELTSDVDEASRSGS